MRRRDHKIKRWMSLWIMASILITSVLQPPIKISGAKVVGLQKISNAYINLWVNPLDGRFALSTNEGSPYREKDQQEALLYEEGELDTSFVTYRIDGKDYIFGNTYNNNQAQGGFIQKPQVIKGTNKAIWRINDVYVTQELQVEENEDSATSGNLRIKHTVVNKGTKPVNLGSRLLLDVKVGNEDGPWIQIPKEGFIQRETVFEAEKVPAYYTLTKSGDDLDIVGYHQLVDWEGNKPDQLVFAHWNGISKTKWDYSVAQGRSITTSANEYKKGDTACGLYWNPMDLQPGEEHVFETQYGLGDFITQQDVDFLATVKAPYKVKDMVEGASSQMVTISLEIDNTLIHSKRMLETKAAILLPEGLKIDKTSSAIQEFGTIEKGQLTTKEWRIEIPYAEESRVYEYEVSVSTLGVKQQGIKKKIFVPGRHERLPQVFYSDYGPKIFSDEDDSKIMLLKGKGFTLLEDKESWDLEVIKKGHQEPLYIEKNLIQIVDNETIQIALKDRVKALDEAEVVYDISLNHKLDDRLDYDFFEGVKVTRSLTYLPKTFKSIKIYEEVVGGKSYYTIGKGNGNKIMEIRGAVTELIPGESYSVLGSTPVKIHDNLYYQGEDLLIKLGGATKENQRDQLIIKGNGRLSAKVEKRDDARAVLLSGRLYYDPASYLFQMDKTIAHEDKIVQLGYLPLIIRGIKLRGTKDLEVKADFALDTRRISSLLGEFTPEPITTSLKGIELTKEGLFYKDSVAINLPPMMIGGFQTKPGAPSYLFIDTEINSYGFATTWMNRSLGLDSLEGKLLFNESWEPTSIKLKTVFKKPRPIGQSGVGIKYLDGGVYGLDQAWKQNISDMELRAGFGVEDMLSGSAAIGSFRLLDGDVRGILNRQGFSFNGQGNLLTIPITDMKGYVSRRSANIRGNLDILGTIQGLSQVSIEPNYLGGALEGKFLIPHGLPIVGGEKIGGFEAGFSTKSLHSSFEFLKCDIGVTYYWGEADIDIEVETPSILDIVSNIIMLPQDAFVYEGQLTDLAMDLSYIKRVKVDKRENLLFEVGYNGEIPPVLKVEDPMGNPYILRWRGEDDNPNALYQRIEAKDAPSGKEEKYIGFSVNKPIEGSWKVITDKEVTIKVYEIKDLPDIKDLNVQKKSSSLVEASWVSQQKDLIMNFYLVSEGNQKVVKELKANIPSTKGKVLLEIPKATSTGTYQVLAKIKRGDYGYSEVKSNSIEITDPLEPKKPRNFKVVSVGNGTLQASWQATSTKPTGYLIRPVNWREEEALRGAVVYAKGDANKVRFGGILEDKEGEAYGWLTGRHYDLELMAIREDDEGGMHYSQPVVSRVYLPEVKAPTVEVNLTAREGKLIKEGMEGDIEVYRTNGDGITWTFDEITGNATEYRIVLNGIRVSQGDLSIKSGNMILKEGKNHLRIEVVNKKQEVGNQDFILYCDTQQPYLFLQSPTDLALMEGDTIEVKGQTEATAKLRVNGIDIPVSQEGSFNTKISIEVLKDREILVESQDRAGNKTTYRQQVLLAPRTIKKVRIISPKSMVKGETYKLTLEATDDKGNKWTLPQGAVSWALLEEDSSTHLTKEGEITIRKKGEEVFVRGMYSLSKDYVLEDVVALEVNEEDPPPVVEPPVPEEDHEDSGLNQKDNGIYIPPNKDKKVIYGKGLTLWIQKNSVMRGTYLEIDRLSKKTTETLVSTEMILLSPLYSLNLKGTKKLKKEASLALQYQSKAVYPQEQIGLYRWSDNQGWQLVGGEMDSQTGMMIGVIETMGTYGIFYNKHLKKMEDLQGRWSQDSIKRLIFEGIIQGIDTSDGTYFRPKRMITRGEFIKMLAGIERITKNPSKSSKSEGEIKMAPIFADSEDIPKWAMETVVYGYEQNWLKGEVRGDQVYIHPMDFITRSEAIALIGRVMESKKKEASTFKDWDQVPLWAKEYVDILVHYNIIKGYEDNTLRPGNNITREEAAVMLERYLRLKRKNTD